MSRPRDAEAGSAGRPGSLDVSAPGAAAAAIYAAHPGAARPRHGLRSRLLRPRRPEWAGVTGTQSPGGLGAPAGAAGRAVVLPCEWGWRGWREAPPPHLAGEPPSPRMESPQPAAETPRLLARPPSQAQRPLRRELRSRKPSL